MVKQMSLFEELGVKIFDAGAPVAKKKESKRVAAVKKEPKRVDTSLPTWELHFFDKDRAQRIEWYRAADEEKAKTKCMSDYAGAAVFHVIQSKRTLEEIQALD